MKYLCLAYGDEKDWKELSKAEQDALLEQDEALRRRGDLVAAVDQAATTVRAWDGVPETTQGGFAESRVPLAGFAIIDAPDLERAIELRPIDQINDTGPTAVGVLAHAPRVNTEPTPVVTDEHRRLEPFIGTWTVTGENTGTAPNAPNTPVTGEESYAWLPGRFFLLGHWDRRFGTDRHVGIHIIRYDQTTGQYSSYNVDNFGYARTYRVAQRDGVWSFTGDWERATWALGADGRTMTIDWEATEDGETWVPLCHLEATKQV